MIIAITGPTGVGKTKLSVALAKKYHGIVVNCDAMQVYKGMDIGTAKIKEEEKEGVIHYLFDIVSPEVNYTVYDYQKDARKIIEENKDKTIIFVGGTGLYLKATLFDYRFSEEKSNETYEEYSNEELYQMCLKKDEKCLIHPNNRRRMIRFLQKATTASVEPKLLYDATFIGLTTNRDHLYEIIDKRVDKMFEEGLLEEVKKFYDQHLNSKALQTAIGYKELYSYFEGNLSLEETKELIKKNSRHYAKRQYTFFNHQLSVQWFSVNYEDFQKTIKEVSSVIEKQA
uniref:tRNA (adenosine(37)-N6)-dimethylallyltransferase MiaA n=1 Tax=Candidatus Ventrenecus sp. TaxID=3085654 RepID=UPI003FEE2B04